MKLSRIPFPAFMALGAAMFLAALLFVDKTVAADYIRCAVLALAATVMFQIFYIGIAHGDDPNKRFPNRAVWLMGISFVLGMIGPLHYMVDRIGNELAFFPTIPFAASLVVAEVWLYALNKRY